MPEFIAILRSGDIYKEGKKKEEKKEIEISKKIKNNVPIAKKENYEQQHYGFVSYPIQIAKTASKTSENSLDKLIFELENKKAIENIKDPLTVTIMYPLLKLCREKDYLQDGFYINFYFS